MAASIGDALVAKAKKFREVESLQHESIKNVPELLVKISKFLQDHETASINDCTHTVFDNYSDWWMNNTPTYKLAVAEDNTVDQLHRVIAQLYDLGIPLTLTEKRTTVIRFIQDVEIWGTQEKCVSAVELIDCQGAFMKLLGKTIGSVYPKQEFLDCVVFDATGLSRTKGIMKTSVRLVWSKIVVDRTRAGKIHDYVVFRFKDSQEPGVKAFEEQVQKYNGKENQWANIFNDSIYFGRFGIRMPLCDRVSPAPLKKPEHRPFKPIGVVRCKYKQGEIESVFESVERICDATDLSGEEWIRIGCIRRDAGQELTDWQAPNFTPPVASRNHSLGGGGGGKRQPGRVQMRTLGGSDRPVRSQPRTHQQTQQEHLTTVQRQFDGTVAEFREQLEKALGGQQGENFTEDAEKLVWQQPGDTGRIEMKASNHRVYMTGKSHQVRSLCTTVARFCRQAGDAASTVGTARSSLPGSRSELESKPGSERNPINVFAPNRRFTPSAVYAPSQVHSTTSYESTSRVNTQCEIRRLAIKEFSPQGNCELELKIGDHVTIKHDPEVNDANVNRWVHGINERGEDGWFPYSFTDPLQLTEESEQT